MNTYKYAVVRKFPDNCLLVGLCDTADEAFDVIEEFYVANPESKIIYTIKRMLLGYDKGEEQCYLE